MTALSLITLGVADVGRATRFYEALGFRRSVSESQPAISFFQAGGIVLALFGREALAEDAGLPAEPRAPFGGMTLARNLASRAAVDEAFAAAVAAGARPLKTPAEVFWGGYLGYVADPDGHPIEFTHNPFWPLTGEGAIVLPD